MLIRRIASLFPRVCLLALALTSSAQAAGKIDFGPVYVNMRVLENGDVRDRLDMYGARGDATLQVFPGHCYLKGLVVKPSITFADGKGTFFATGIGVGYAVPVMDKVLVTTAVGYTYCSLNTHVSYPDFGLFHLKQDTSSTAPYLGIDVSYKVLPCLLLSASYQYGWARTRTTIETLGFSKGKSSGGTYSAMVDYYFTECWSVNAAWAYNEMLTHELHGTKSNGCRIGLGYTY